MPERVSSSSPAVAARGAPLASRGGATPRVLRVDGRSCSLAELAFVEMLILRGSAADEAFRSAVQEHTGLALPVQANGASVEAQRQLFWLGPDEWVFRTREAGGAARISALLGAALKGQHHALVEVGDGYTTLELRGAGAADLIARGCPLDLHARAFPSGSLAQSHIAKANVTLLCLRAGEHYEVTVRRSFAGYLYDWMRAAAGELEKPANVAQKAH